MKVHFLRLRFAVSVLLVVACALFLPGAIGAYESEQSARAEALKLYNELLSFKDSVIFKERGFGGGNPQANAWLGKAEEMRDAFNASDFSIMLKMVPGSMIQVGMEYLKTGGADNDLTLMFREEIEAELKQ
jgi:hypothetical protein